MQTAEPRKDFHPSPGTSGCEPANRSACILPLRKARTASCDCSWAGGLPAETLVVNVLERLVLPSNPYRNPDNSLEVTLVFTPTQLTVTATVHTRKLGRHVRELLAIRDSLNAPR